LFVARCLPAMVERNMLGRRPLARQVVLLMLTLPSMAHGFVGKKTTDMKLLEAFPDFFKFVMFWWCVLVFGVMSVFILDQLMFKYRGPATISWSTSFVFDGRASREAYWAQFVDPSAWKATHPILESADVRMVDFKTGDGNAAVVATERKENEEIQDEVSGALDEAALEPSARLKPVELKSFVPGLGLILRHKSGNDLPHGLAREGLFFCSRECTALETPKDKPWRFEMKTVEAGAGHAFVPGTEVVAVLLHPTAEDGTIVCEMSGRGSLTSRVWRWWMGLEKLSVEGAQVMLEAISAGLGRPTNKKED